MAPPTNPIGEGTTNVSVNMSETLKKEAMALAKVSGMSLSAYLKAVIESAVEAGDVYIKPKAVKKPKNND